MAFPGEEVSLTGEDSGKGFPGTAVDLSGQGDQIDPGLAEFITGEQRIAATPELGELPRFSATPEGDVFDITLGLLSTFDEQAQRDVIKEAIPEAKFEITPDGSTIVEVPDEEGETRRSVLNRPGFSKSDVTRGIAQVLAFVPSARLASLGRSITQRLAIGGGTAAATEAGLQEAGKALGREEGDPGEIALAGVLGVGGEALGAGARALAAGRQARQLDLAREDLGAIQQQTAPAREAQEAIQRETDVRVGLFPAQQTLQPTTLLKQRLVPQLEAGARKAARELESQNLEAFDATSALVNTIAPPEAITGAAARFRNASQKAIDARIESRKAATQGLYKDAFEEADARGVAWFRDNAELIRPVNDLIGGILEDAPPGSEFERVGKRLANFMKPSKQTNIIPSLRQLQKAKQSMQDMIDDQGGKAVSNTLKREIVIVQGELRDRLRQASPLYANADDRFKALSPAVEEVESSVLGQVANIDETLLKNITRRVFDASETNPELIKKTKDIIDNVDPGAWDDLLRLEFQRRFAGIETLAEDIPGELVGNVPGQMRRAIFGNPEQRRTLLSAMGNQQRRNFVYLDELLRRASAGRQAGSPTAPFQQAIEKLKGVTGVIRDMVVRPLDTLQRTGERGIFDSNVAKLTDVLFNPKWEPTMRQIRTLNPNSDKAGRLFQELMDASKASAQLVRAEEE
ncbi:MAG: hypothetical protein V3W52_17355 [Syntrophobacteria bacterium]